MTHEHYDVIVIGAGLGGLSAAGYLAKAGKKVLILEHHTIPGGYAHEFRRGKFRFDVSLHALDGAGPGGWAYPTLHELGVLSQVRFHRLDPFYTVRAPDHEITVHADPLRYEAELVRQFPLERQGIHGLIDAMIRVFTEVRRSMEEREIGLPTSLEQFPVQFPNMLAAMGTSWSEFMSEHIRDPRLQALFSVLWPYYGLPPSRLNAMTFIIIWVSYHLFGAYYPEGGSMAMSRALERSFKSHGGEIVYRQNVNHMEIKDGLATGVETEQGIKASAEVIISNANAPDTLLRFVGREHLPAGLIQKIEKEHPSLSNLVVFLGLERDFSPSFDHHETFMMNSYDLEADYQNINAGRFEQVGFVMTQYNRYDPGCAPEGNGIFSLMCLAPWEYADQWGTGGNLDHYSQNPRYLEIKQAAGEALLARAEKLLPGLREAIKYIEIATPLTNVRYSLNPGGSIYGSEQSVNNMYINRLSAATPIPNLFLSSAWVMGGGQSAALLGGRDVARQVLGYFNGESDRSLMFTQAQIPVQEEHTVVEAQATPPTGRMPARTLIAAGTKRKVELGQPGKPAVFVFHTQETAQASLEVNQVVRAKFPLSSQVLVASVVDLHKIPRMFRVFAEDAMRKSYQQAAADLPQGLDPEEYVLILPDWDGKIAESVGLNNLDKAAGIVVLDAQGKLRGVSQVSPLGQTALGFLEK